ncbi:unnamed protein product [Meloidogyne enterolobii]|uniref:Uncharacterized protein n=1 Tax=Meloidogyne enterolobii TaxID=390850 RepID=A0ACB0YXK9_MELEN
MFIRRTGFFCIGRFWDVSFNMLVGLIVYLPLASLLLLSHLFFANFTLFSSSKYCFLQFHFPSIFVNYFEI